MTGSASVPTPELDKLKRAKEAWGIEHVGEFLEWLEGQKIFLARWMTHEHTDECRDDDGDLICGTPREYIAPLHEPVEELLARYVGVDPKKIEMEKRALLESLRKGG